MRSAPTTVLELPVLPLRGFVLLPGGIAPINVGRPETLEALTAVGEDKHILCVTQRDPRVDRPSLADLYPIGTLGIVQRVIRARQEVVTAIIQGIDRVGLLAELAREPCLRARANVLPSRMPAGMNAEFGALIRSVRELYVELVTESPSLPDELATMAQNIDDASALADFVAGALPMPVEARQQLLETLDVAQRLQRLTEILVREREAQRLMAKIRSDVEKKVTDTQREYFLREQLQAIRKQLGEDDEGREVGALRARVEKAGLPEEARREAERELARLEHMTPAAAEYAVARTYLEWLAELPWTRTTAHAVELREAEEILDADHYGTEQAAAPGME